MRSVAGGEDVQKDQLGGTPQVQIKLDRGAIARYNLNVSDVQETISIAVGGASAGQVFEGIRRFDIYVRLEESSRDRTDVIRDLKVRNEQGQQIPLIELASVEEVAGPRSEERRVGKECRCR